MAANEKLTNNTDEMTLGDLFESSAILDVPFFQRPYKWKAKKVTKFQEDLERLLFDEDGEELHFLGAVIMQGQKVPVTHARPFRIIDGQQRLTTVYLHVLAAVRVLVEEGSFDFAKAVFLDRLATRKQTGDASNLTLSPSGQDRASLNKVVHDLLKLKDFGKSLDGFEFKPLTTGVGVSSKQIETNHRQALKFMKNHFEDGGEQSIEKIVSVILQRMTIVQIDIKDALDGPKIFDSLNSAHETMTVGELVKNDVLGRGINKSSGEMQQIVDLHWSPFFERFESNRLFDDYFFPYGLCMNPNWRKTEVYSELQREWNSKHLSPSEIIDQLALLQPDYLAIALGVQAAGSSNAVHKVILRMRDAGCPSSIYPFVMNVSYGARTDTLDLQVAEGLLNRVDSFLTRRAVCGIEPTGLHAVFKGLWQDIQHVDQAQMIPLFEEIIRLKPTVQWPSDTQVRDAARNRNFYGARIGRFLLEEYNRSLGGDLVGGTFQIEHILPRNPPLKSDWRTDFTDLERSELVDSIGNLTLITPRMNGEVSNKSYSEKRKEYSENSQFKITREIADKYDSWKPDDVRLRSEEIGEWIVATWPF